MVQMRAELQTPRAPKQQIDDDSRVVDLGRVEVRAGAEAVRIGMLVARGERGGERIGGEGGGEGRRDGCV